MALEYFLDLCTDLAVPDIYARIEALLGDSITRVRQERVRTIVAPDVIVVAGKTSNFRRKVVKETFNLEVNVDVYFRLDKFEKYEQGVMTAVGVSLELLRTTNSDGLLRFIDTPEVLRKHGTLIFEPKAAEWNHARELAKEPYVLAPITENEAA